MSDLRNARLRALHSQLLESAREFPFLLCAAVTAHDGDLLWPQTQISPDGFHFGLIASEWRDVLGVKHPPLPLPLCNTRWIWMDDRVWEVAFYDSRDLSSIRGEYGAENIDADALRAEDARNEAAIGQFKRLARQCAGNLNLQRPVWFELNDSVKSDDHADRWLEKLFCEPFVDSGGLENSMLVRRLSVNAFSASAMAIELICDDESKAKSRAREQTADCVSVQNSQPIGVAQANGPLAPLGQLLFLTSQILGLARKAILGGKAILKIRELHPNDRVPRIDEIAQVSTNLSSIPIYLAFKSPTEDPRGGMVPIYHRESFGGWFTANPDVQHLFEAVWVAHTALPTALREAVNAPSDESFRRFGSLLAEFEPVVAAVQRWHDAHVPQPFAPRPHQPTAQELSIIYRAMREKGSKGPSPVPTPRKTELPSNSLTPFAGGTLVFFSDRIELYGVDICSGDGARQPRKVLEVLADKHSDVTFQAFPTKRLREAAGISKGEDAVAGIIRRLRVRIQQALLEKDINCGLTDVILSGGPGYRLSNRVTVQFVDEPPDADGRGGDATESVAAVPPHSVAAASHSVVEAAPGVVKGGPHVVAAARRRWILEQEAAGRELDADAVAKELGCSLRAAQRDLAKVKKAAGSLHTS